MGEIGNRCVSGCRSLAPSAATLAFADALKERCDAVGAVVSAVHPYSSFMEPFFLFSHTTIGKLE